MQGAWGVETWRENSWWRWRVVGYGVQGSGNKAMHLSFEVSQIQTPLRLENNQWNNDSFRGFREIMSFFDPKRSPPPPIPQIARGEHGHCAAGGAESKRGGWYDGWCGTRGLKVTYTHRKPVFLYPLPNAIPIHKLQRYPKKKRKHTRKKTKTMKMQKKERRRMGWTITHLCEGEKRGMVELRGGRVLLESQ